MARSACQQRGVQLCGTDCPHGNYPAWDEKLSFGHVTFRTSTGSSWVPVEVLKDSPLPAAIQQPGDQVRVKGGTHPPLKLLHKLQKLDSADTDLVSKL